MTKPHPTSIYRIERASKKSWRLVERGTTKRGIRSKDSCVLAVFAHRPDAKETAVKLKELVK